MAKLRRLSGKEVCAILSAHGFAEVRRRGSHMIMQRESANGGITVPVPNYKEIKTGTLRAIIRQSKLPRAEFE